MTRRCSTRSGPPVTATRAPRLLRLRFGGWVQLDAVLAHEPVVLKATGGRVESGGVLETELLGRPGKSDPGLIHDQGQQLVPASSGARPSRARARAGRRGGLRVGGRACARLRVVRFR